MTSIPHRPTSRPRVVFPSEVTFYSTIITSGDHIRFDSAVNQPFPYLERKRSYSEFPFWPLFRWSFHQRWFPRRGWAKRLTSKWNWQIFFFSFCSGWRHHTGIFARLLVYVQNWRQTLKKARSCVRKSAYFWACDMDDPSDRIFYVPVSLKNLQASLTGLALRDGF